VKEALLKSLRAWLFVLVKKSPKQAQVQGQIYVLGKVNDFFEESEIDIANRLNRLSRESGIPNFTNGRLESRSGNGN
jgi:hypothetical protein